MGNISLATRIPNIIHFCYGFRDSGPFGLVEYLAIRSAFDLNHPDQLYFYYNKSPAGPWWDLAQRFLTPVKVQPPLAVFGKLLRRYAHRADVFRLDILIEHGGIYLDMDTLCIRSFGDLLNHRLVMGRQAACRANSPAASGEAASVGATVGGGLCNAVMLSEPNSPFLLEWKERYRDFNPRKWDHHSVKLPLRLAATPKLKPHIHVLGPNAFFFPLWDNMDALFASDDRSLFADSYCTHYWQSFTREQYLDTITTGYIHKSDSNFAFLARRHLHDLDLKRAWEPRDVVPR